MAPAAEQGSWGDAMEMEMGNNEEISSELLSQGASSSGNGNVGAWQKVTYPKKQRRQEKAKDKGLGQDVKTTAVGSSESKAFQILEKETEARRARRTAAVNGDQANEQQFVDDDSDAEVEEHGHMNGAMNGVEEAPKKTKKVKKPKVSVADAAKAIDIEDLTSFLSDIGESYANLPDVQLMRCADYFVRAFSSVSTAQFSWEKISKNPLAKVVEIPIRDVPQPVCRILSDWVVQRPLDAISKFAFWALTDILSDTSLQTSQLKGSKAPVNPVSTKTKVGVMVMLAVILRRRPDALLQESAKLRSRDFQGPAKLYTLAWAFSQVARGDLVAGMYFWVHNLLPVALGMSSTPISRDICLQFIESILLADDVRKARTVLLNGATRKGERLVPAASLDALLHASFCIESSRNKATDRFRAVYPLVKEIALAGNYRSKATKPVAQILLPFCITAAAQEPEELSLEACSLFRWCLAQTDDCYKQWGRLHMENLKGSTRIFEYLSANWKESQSVLSPLNALKALVASLRTQHRRIGADDSAVKKAEMSCRNLEKKMSEMRKCLKATVTIGCAVAMAYSLYLVGPQLNSWNWDGKLLLSKTHAFI